MKPDPSFVELPMSFWAHVRAISEQIGYTSTRLTTEGQVNIPSPTDMVSALNARQLDASHISDSCGNLSTLGMLLSRYFEHRAAVLNDFVRPRLMNAERAKEIFDRLHQEWKPKCPIPMNKQKGEKRAPAYFTGIINMLIEANCECLSCDYDPHRLTTITREHKPLRTLARRVDGAFQGTVNPIAIWEIKEYYHTTTFGSRVADGVYETLLDGMELQELHQHEHVKVLHYLMVDAYYTWWTLGRSYLCRIIDMLHMGFVDEALFGYEVVERMPDIVREWADLARST